MEEQNTLYIVTFKNGPWFKVGKSRSNKFLKRLYRLQNNFGPLDKIYIAQHIGKSEVRKVELKLLNEIERPNIEDVYKDLKFKLKGGGKTEIRHMGHFDKCFELYKKLEGWKGCKTSEYTERLLTEEEFAEKIRLEIEEYNKRRLENQ